MSTVDTRGLLIAGTLGVVRELGVGAVSARAIGARAGVNQALVFYHFGTVDNLLAEACRTETTRVVAGYRERFAEVGSLRELLAVGRAVHAIEQDAGNVAVLAPLLAAAHANPVLRPAVADGLRLWTDEIESVLRRVLAAGPLDGLFDARALATGISAAFVGLELFDTVDPGGRATRWPNWTGWARSRRCWTRWGRWPAGRCGRSWGGWTADRVRGAVSGARRGGACGCSAGAARSSPRR
jgi:AcrR family transcriptional regulator